MALVATLPANAADVPDGAPVQAIAPRSVYGWTGLYAGVNAGGVLGDAAVRREKQNWVKSIVDGCGAEACFTGLFARAN